MSAATGPAARPTPSTSPAPVLTDPPPLGDDVGPVRLLARTCRAEWTRLRTVRSTWWFAVVATVALVGLGALLGLEAASDPPEVQGEPAWTTAQFTAVPAQFAFLGLAVLAVTSDHATGAIVPTLQWTPRRGTLFAARTLVVTAVSTGLGLVLAAAAALAAWTTAGGALTLGAGDGLATLGRVGAVYGCGTLLGAGLGFVLRSTAGAVISAFLLVLVLPLLLPQFGEWTATVARWLPGSGGFWVLTEGEVPGMTRTSSAAVLLGWAVGAAALGALRLLRDDADR